MHGARQATAPPAPCCSCAPCCHLPGWNIIRPSLHGARRQLAHLLHLQEENEAEEEVLDGVASVLAIALRRWGDGAMPYVEALMPAIGQERPGQHSGQYV